MYDHLDLRAIQAQREIDARRAVRRTDASGGLAPRRADGETRWRHGAAHLRAAWAALTSHPDVAAGATPARSSGGAPTP